MKRFLVIFILFLTACSTQITEETAQENISQEVVEEETIQEKISIEHEEEIIEEQPEKEYSTSRISSEIPSEAEMQLLPDCDGLFFTEYPVDMSELYEITPIGNLAPPGHTFPTDHSYLHLNAGGSSSEKIPLYAPADVTILEVYKTEGFTDDPQDYTIYFALCKDVIGYYNHVKEISTDIENILEDVSCESYGYDESDSCTKILFEKISAGTHMGEVGGLQGNFDFGLIDLSKELGYIHLERYPTRSRYVHCAYDYYPEDMQETFFDLIKREDTKYPCGVIEQDEEGTAKGNWFHETAEKEYVVDWSTYLALVADNNYPDMQVISIGGKIMDAAKFEFLPQSSGTKNRDFSDVKFDGKVYCYEDEHPYENGESVDDGKILLQLVDEETLHIEWQSSSCSSSEELNDPEVYER